MADAQRATPSATHRPRRRLGHATMIVLRAAIAALAIAAASAQLINNWVPGICSSDQLTPSVGVGCGIIASDLKAVSMRSVGCGRSATQEGAVRGQGHSSNVLKPAVPLGQGRAPPLGAPGRQLAPLCTDVSCCRSILRRARRRSGPSCRTCCATSSATSRATRLTPSASTASTWTICTTTHRLRCPRTCLSCPGPGQTPASRTRSPPPGTT